MAGRFSRFRKVLGLGEGLRLYSHFKTGLKSPIHLSFLEHPVYFRGINSDAKMFEQIFVNKEYDVKIPFDPAFIFDLGANVGYASIFFANRFPGSKIFAIEPEENNYRMAEKNLAPYKNTRLIKGAVWHQPEVISVVDKGYGEAAYMVEKGTGGNEIRAYTIREIMDLMGASQIDILKVDVEGTEKELFEHGYEEWLPSTKVLITETHDRYKAGCSRALFSMISKYDFSLELSGENLVLYNNELVSVY